jgi:MraZ protein
MFSGSSTHTLDAKGRAVLPAKFRYRLGETFMLTRGMGGCLWVFPDEEWRALEEKLAAVSLTSKGGLALQRFFLGAAVECKVDDQGRMPISPFLREVAKIEKEMVVVGIGRRIVIWAREVWDAYNAEELSDEVVQALAGEMAIEL